MDTLADACERAGIETLFRSDHYLSFSNHERTARAWTTIAGLAARTTKLPRDARLPGGVPEPSLLANAVTTADHISGGRVELGMGAGWNELEHEAFGFAVPAAPRAAIEHLAEQIEIVHRLWTEEHVSFEGKHYRLVDCPALPKRAEAPPDAARRRPREAGQCEPAARFADRYNVIGSSLEEYAAARQALDDACERAERDPKTLGMSIMSGFLLGSNEHELLNHARDARALGLGRRSARPSSASAGAGWPAPRTSCSRDSAGSPRSASSASRSSASSTRTSTPSRCSARSPGA